MRLACVGTGLIGTSTALAARRSADVTVSGWDEDPEVLAVAALWAVAAATLPLMVRGRTPVLDVVGALIWAAARIAATNGIDKPVLNVFRMLGQMRGNRVSATSSSKVPGSIHSPAHDVHSITALATCPAPKITIRQSA